MNASHLERLEARQLFAAVFPEIQNFENDTDTYTPADSNPFNDPPSGSPPASVKDVRTGASGLVEEVPSGFEGVSAFSGSKLGAVYFNDPNNGPYGQFSKFPSPNANPNGTGSYSFVVDIYTDSRIAPTFGVAGGGHGNGSNSVPDFWWTNGVSNVTTGASYMTESGFTAEVLDNGTAGNRNWKFTTTAGGNPAFTAALNTWYTLEVKYKNVAGKVAIEHNIFNKAHTQRLYTYTIPAASVYQGPFNFSSLGGPSYSWFVYADTNVINNHLFVDNWGVKRPVDYIAPSADIINVSPDPRTTSVSSINIAFTEKVRNFDRSDLRLTRNGTNITLTTSQGLSSSDDGKNWVLSGLSSLTGTNGSYVLTLRKLNSGIVDLSGHALASDASDSWQKNSATTSTASQTALISPTTSPLTSSSTRIADQLFSSPAIG